MTPQERARLDKKYGDLIMYVRNVRDGKLAQNNDNIKNYVKTFYRTRITDAAKALVIEFAKKNKAVFGNAKTKDEQKRIIEEVIEYWDHTYLPQILQDIGLYVWGTDPNALQRVLKTLDETPFIKMAKEYARVANSSGPPDDEEQQDEPTPLHEGDGPSVLRQIGSNVKKAAGMGALAALSKAGPVTQGVVAMGMGAARILKPATDKLKSKIAGYFGSNSSSTTNSNVRTRRGGHNSTGSDFTPREESIEKERSQSKIEKLLEDIEKNTREGEGEKEKSSALGNFASIAARALPYIASALGVLGAFMGIRTALPPGLKVPGGPAAGPATTIKPNPARAPSTPGKPSLFSRAKEAGSKIKENGLLKSAKEGLIGGSKSLGKGAIGMAGGAIGALGRGLGVVGRVLDVADLGRAVIGGDSKDIAETGGRVAGGWGAVAAASGGIATTSLAIGGMTGVFAPIVTPLVALGMGAGAYYGGSKIGSAIGKKLIGADKLDEKKKQFVQTAGGGGTGTLTRHIETGNSDGSYGKINPNDRGSPSYGAYQFRLEGGGLQRLLRYIHRTKEMAPLMEKFNGKKPGSKEFDDVWKSLGDDPLMKKAQDTVWNTEYRIPALEWAKSRGVKSNAVLDEIIASSYTAGPILTRRAIDKAAETENFENLDVKAQGKLIIAELDKFNGKNQFEASRLDKQKSYFNDNIDSVTAAEKDVVSKVGPTNSTLVKAPTQQEKPMAALVRGVANIAPPKDVVPHSPTPRAAAVVPHSPTPRAAAVVPQENKATTGNKTVINAPTINNNKTISNETKALPGPVRNSSPNQRILQDKSRQ